MVALPPPVFLAPTGFTDPVAVDADDPAVWRDARHPERSQILGTDKGGSGTGAVYVFGLDGRTVQILGGLDRPNNVDVEYGLAGTDVAVATERERSRLKVFAVNRASGRWRDMTGRTAVFAGESGDAALPMGIALYKRPRDGAVFAIVSRKGGPATGYLHQYRLTVADGRVDASFVRAFGAFSGRKEIESLAVDDARGEVYVSDETFGTRRYSADPDDAGVQRELFNTQGFRADHEGIATGSGLLVCTDQIEGDSVYHLYDLKPGRGPRGTRATFRGGVDATDGIEVCDRPLGPRFPRGVMLAMDSGPKRFALWDWGAVRKIAGR